MKKNFIRTWNVTKKPLMITLIMLVLCGFIYVAVLTGLGQLFFPKEANGSLIYDFNGNVIGSKLIGQNPIDDRFMKCRPSAVGYNQYTQEEIENGEFGGVGSGSSNLAPSNPDLQKRIAEQVAAIIELYAANGIMITAADIPSDLVTASGSGLDPHITPTAAAFQLQLIEKTSGINKEILNTIVEKHTTEKFVGVLGEKTVNVLGVNLEIAQILGLVK